MSSAALVLDPPLRAGVPTSTEEWPTVGPGTGFPMLDQSVLQCAPGAPARRSTDQAEEVLFVLRGEGTLQVNGSRHDLGPETGVCLGPQHEYVLEGGGEPAMRILRVKIPDPGPRPSGGDLLVVRRLAEQQAQAATTQREFRIVADPETGLRSATQFVGYVPAARAPDHFHTYDEVIYVLDGEGELQWEGECRRVRSGSSIQLPARTVHCLQNTGQDVMRLVGVFRPAGSPAAAYLPDGTPAHPGAPPIST